MGIGAEARAAAWPPTVEGVNAWLWGPQGRTRVRHALDRYRLPGTLADDLAQEVLYRAWRAIGRGETIVSVPAFATTLLSRAAVDLLRGRTRRAEARERPGAEAGDPDAEAGAGRGAGCDPVGNGVAAAIDPPVADHLRRSVHGLLGARPATGAAALAYVTLVADDVPPPKGCPAPQGGVDADEALAWAALWCTGRDDCFDAASNADPATVRARRSRALRAMRALLAQAATGLGEDDRA
jgi:DNA-directed RNA polymerase specialized sigma24 family protein